MNPYTGEIHPANSDEELEAIKEIEKDLKHRNLTKPILHLEVGRRFKAMGSWWSVEEVDSDRDRLIIAPVPRPKLDDPPPKRRLTKKKRSNRKKRKR